MQKGCTLCKSSAMVGLGFFTRNMLALGNVNCRRAVLGINAGRVLASGIDARRAMPTLGDAIHAGPPWASTPGGPSLGRQQPRRACPGRRRPNHAGFGRRQALPAHPEHRRPSYGGSGVRLLWRGCPEHRSSARATFGCDAYHGPALSVDVQWLFSLGVAIHAVPALGVDARGTLALGVDAPEGPCRRQGRPPLIKIVYFNFVDARKQRSLCRRPLRSSPLHQTTQMQPIAFLLQILLCLRCEEFWESATLMQLPACLMFDISIELLQAACVGCVCVG